MLRKLFKWSRNHDTGEPKKNTAEDYDTDEEFQAPELAPADIEMSMDLMCRRREEILRQQYGATKAHEDYIL